VLESGEQLVVTVGVAGDQWGPTGGTFTVATPDGHELGSKTGINELTVTGLAPGDYLVRYQAPTGFDVTPTPGGPQAPAVTVHIGAATIPVVSFTVTTTSPSSCPMPAPALHHPTSC
jgi:hypothetical protein